MRPLSLLPASLLVLASAAQAQTTPYPPADTAPMSTVQVTAPVKPVRIHSDEAQNITGSYAMSNGWYLKVRTASRYIMATIDNEKPIQLLAVAPYKFVSANGNVTMDFNQGDWGEDMTMSYRPDAALAQVIVISSQVAQR